MSNQIDLEFKWMINEPSCFIHIKMLVWMMNGITIIIRLFQVQVCLVLSCMGNMFVCLVQLKIPSSPDDKSASKCTQS